MYDLIKRHAALAQVGRDVEVANAKLDGLAEYTEGLVAQTVRLDLRVQTLSPMVSELGQELLKQELAGFAMHGMSLGLRMYPYRAGR